MTNDGAQQVLERLESDAEFGERVKSTGTEGGPDAAIALLHSEGYDVTAGDMRDAFLDRFGDELSPEQLDAVAGVTREQVSGMLITFGVGLVATVAAAAAV